MFIMLGKGTDWTPEDQNNFFIIFNEEKLRWTGVQPQPQSGYRYVNTKGPKNKKQG